MASGTDRQRAAQRPAELAAERAHEDEVARSQAGRGDIFGDVFARRISRRSLLKASAATAALVIAPGAATGSAQTIGKPRGPRPAQGIAFQPIGPESSTSQAVKAANGYSNTALLAWGDPIHRGMDPFDASALTAEEPTLRFGYNCDYIDWHEISPNGDGLLWVNHEYTNEEIIFPDYDPDSPTKKQVDIGLAAHGVVRLSSCAGTEEAGSMQNSALVTNAVFTDSPICGFRVLPQDMTR